MRPLPKVLDPDHRLLRLCQLNQLSLSSTVSWPGCFRGAIENNHKTIARRGCLFRTPLTRISHAATSKKPLLLAWTTPARHPLESHPRQPRQPHVRKLCEKYGLVDFQTVFATQSSRRQIHADKVQPALSPGTWIPTCARAKRTLPHRVARLVHDFQTMRSVRRSDPVDILPTAEAGGFQRLC
jgi:hypothetical protein